MSDVFLYLNDNITNITLTPVFLTVVFIFWGLLFFSILNIIFYPEYGFTYIIVGLFAGWTLYRLISIDKLWKQGNDLEHFDDKKELESKENDNKQDNIDESHN